MTRRTVVLVDGEHYPEVVRDALRAVAAGEQPVLALVLGGTEKVARHGADLHLGVPARWLPRGGRGPSPEGEVAAGALRAALDEVAPDAVLDWSDEPVMTTALRHRLAAVALAAGVPYEGADFIFTPPPRPRMAARPSVAVIGVGKRTGKTAVSGEVTRAAMRAGYQPIVVAMGRGGPSAPVHVPAGADLDPVSLLGIADDGGHAASDFYEDAVTTGAATVGARRCGGGLAGGVAISNVPDAVRLANGLDGDLLILEGSGASVPPVHADATALVLPVGTDLARLQDQVGVYRLLLADLVIVSMGVSPRTSARQVDAVVEVLRSFSRRVPVLSTVLRPVPLGPVSGAKVFFATTAPADIAAWIATSLQSEHGCEVVATSHHLADREALDRDLRNAGTFDVLLVELKAAAVDIAARFAANVGARIVFCDNRPFLQRAVDGPNTTGPPGHELDERIVELLDLAGERFAST